MKAAILIEINTDHLSSYTDEHLASLWHVGQINPAPFGDQDACRLAEYIGREIIRRWVQSKGPPLWHHQGQHHANREQITLQQKVKALEAQLAKKEAAK